MNLSGMAFSRCRVGLVLLSGLFLIGACQKRQPTHGGVLRIAKKTPAPVVKPAAAPRNPNDPDERYQEVVLPIVLKHGCSNGSCHGPFRGGGFELASGNKTDQRTYKEFLARIDRQNPEKSELLLKPTRQVPHNGGLVFKVGSCDYNRILAWIKNAPDISCNDEVPPDPQRFAREVVPALSAMGCTNCHSTDATARRRFDLSPLSREKPNLQLAQLTIAGTNPSPYMTWASKVIIAANGDDHHPQKIDPRSCAYRRFYGYLAGSPELHCELDPPDQPGKSAAQMPEFQVFVETVLPAIGRRGCFDLSCHGGGAGGMTLFGRHAHASNGWHEYLNLTARVEDFAHPEKSTLLTTVRNEQPHGGGERLGGPGDCVDEAVVGWLLKRAPRPCQPTPPPTYARFVKEVQPVLDQMTCTQKRCHGESLPKLVLKRHPQTEEVFLANYKATLREVDLEFMPFSGIQLRMREPCAYSVVAAWILNKPKPTCVVHDPAPGVFPKMEEEIQKKAAASSTASPI